MVPEWLINVSIEEMPEPYREIAGYIGKDAAAALYELRGRMIYFSFADFADGTVPEYYGEIIQLIGKGNLIELIGRYKGNYVYFQKADEYLREIRNKKIFTEFNGENYAALGKKYELTERWVREIIEQMRRPALLQNTMPFEQISFF